jgi:hypothetical protein
MDKDVPKRVPPFMRVLLGIFLRFLLGFILFLIIQSIVLFRLIWLCRSLLHL